MASNKSSIPIFLIEDEEIDIELVRRALRRANIPNPFYVAYDGIEALDVLRGTNGKRKLEQPCIILTDISMPRMNGLEFLHTLRNDAELKDSIVFIYTTSSHSDDKDKAYQLNASGYILKENLTTLTGMLDSYSRINEFSDRC